MAIDDEQSVFTESSRYEPYKNYLPQPMLGAGGTRIFEILGRELGEASFRIVYARSWEYDGDWDKYEGTKYEYVISVI